MVKYKDNLISIQLIFAFLIPFTPHLNISNNLQLIKEKSVLYIRAENSLVGLSALVGFASNIYCKEIDVFSLKAILLNLKANKQDQFATPNLSWRTEHF